MRLVSRRDLVSVLAALLFPLSADAAQSTASPVGGVVGTIDGIAYDGDQGFITGWACQQGRRDSIALHIYVDHSAYDTPRGNLVLQNKADFDSEPAVNQACQDRGNGKHRFLVALPSDIARKGEAGKLFVHGIRVVSGVENAAIAGSGAPLHRLDALTTPFITATPAAVNSTTGRNLIPSGSRCRASPASIRRWSIAMIRLMLCARSKPKTLS